MEYKSGINIQKHGCQWPRKYKQQDNCMTANNWRKQISETVTIEMLQLSGFVRVLENLESPGIWLWHFPGLESPGKKPLVLESPGNLLNSTKNMKCMEGNKEN